MIRRTCRSTASHARPSQRSQELAVLCLRLAELEGVEPIDKARLAPQADRIEASIGDLVEVARIKTLDEMGEGHAAVERLRRWLGPNVAPTAS